MSKTYYSPVMTIGTKICEQFGIDPNQVMGIDLHLRINEPATASVYLCPPQGAKVDIAEEMRRFLITEIKE